jgi:hypothetical protein
VKLSLAAFWYKVYIAAAAAAAEQARELQLLNTALGFMNRSMIDALPAVWAETDVNQAYRDAFDVQQMFNASCLCTNVTNLLTGTIGFTDSATYLAGNCSGALIDQLYAGYSQICLFSGHSWQTSLPASAASMLAVFLSSLAFSVGPWDMFSCYCHAAEITFAR